MRGRSCLMRPNAPGVERFAYPGTDRAHHGGQQRRGKDRQGPHASASCSGNRAVLFSAWPRSTRPSIDRALPGALHRSRSCQAIPSSGKRSAGRSTSFRVARA
jgi:hypothetical protein